MDIKEQLTKIPEADKTPLVKWLLETAKQQNTKIEYLQKQNETLQKHNKELQEQVS